MTPADVISIACQIIPQVFDELSGRELSGKVLSFRHTLEDKVEKYMRDKPETRVCTKCKEEKIVEEFYYKKIDSKERYDCVCRRCRIKKSSKDSNERLRCLANKNADLKECFGGKTDVNYLDEEKEQLKEINKIRNRIYSKKQYYASDRSYLLKKYLKRHQDQLERCIYNKSKYEEELKTSDPKKGRNLKCYIIRMGAKIRRLEELITQEQELINNPEKRKESSHE